MSASNPLNLAMVIRAARGLGDLRKEVAFLGGATTGLLLTDTAAADVRSTLDVDVIVEIASRSDYYVFEERLRALGFRNDTSEGAPLCRWLLDDLILDVMPTADEILGFSNRWYAEALHHAQPCALHDDLSIRLVTAPYFIATKLEAFRGRGKGDYLASHDLEDIVAVLDGRPELIAQVSTSPQDLRGYIAEEIKTLLATRAFLDALPGHLAQDSGSQRRMPMLLDRLKMLAMVD